jgi:hypothetical protein
VASEVDGDDTVTGLHEPGNKKTILLAKVAHPGNTDHEGALALIVVGDAAGGTGPG